MVRRSTIPFSNDVAHSYSPVFTTPSTTTTAGKAWKAWKAGRKQINKKRIKPLRVRVRRVRLFISIITLFAAAVFLIEILVSTSPPSSLESEGLVRMKLVNNSSYDSSRFRQNHQEGADQSTRPPHQVRDAGGTNRLPQREVKEALMVIAVYPNSPFKYDVIWSQLECFAGAFDRIIISAPREFRENVTQFVQEVNHAMPEFDSKLDAEFYANDRYDAGLWCDALRGNALNKVAAKNGKKGTYVGGHSQYNRFLLINDSMMAVKKSNEFLEALTEKNASLISLSYWGDKQQQQLQDAAGKKSTNKYHHVERNYWLESPLRAFSLEGIQIYADTICALPKIKWKRDCPYFVSHEEKLRLGHKKKIKRCIVEKTEEEVVTHYSLDKVYGLFPGEDGQGRTWSNNFTFWANMRDHMSFPVVKVNSGPLIEEVIEKRPGDIGMCTASRTR